MKNKTKRDFIKWIKKEIERLKPILGLEIYEIKVVEKQDIGYLDVKFNYPYIDTTIGFNNNAYLDWKIGELRADVVLHELLHMITDPLYAKAVTRYVGKQEIEDERERLTDTLTGIIRRLI